MYYIVNHTEHIIAADSSLLELLSVENINELYTKIALGEINFTTSSEEITITTKNGIKSYQVQNHILSGILGDITLVDILPFTEDKIHLIDDGLFDLMPDAEEVVEEKEEKISFDDEPFDPISDVKETTVEETRSPIVIDIESISQEIGISTDDYNNFLNEYIDTALSLKEDLKNSDEKKYSHAISTLSHLSDILHLPVITNIVEQIENAKLDDRDPLIDSLYVTITRLTTTEINTSEEEIKFQVENSVPTVERDISAESFGIIDLNNVRPIHFDFQIEAAADDLSLPIELIQEFVHDFIEQVHLETEHMLSAYEQGDLNTIQSIGHLLKRTASNLHITALSDSLYKIQLCEESSNLENLIKEYWGLFLSFENKINLTSEMSRK